MRSNQTRRARKGIALIWVAFSLFLLLALMGLALDTGWGLLVGHQLHVTADAAALASAQWVKIDVPTAYQAAYDYGALNTAANAPVLLAPNHDTNDPDGDVVIGRYDRNAHVFTPTLNFPNAVKVVTRRTPTSLGGPVPIHFGPMVGVPTINLTRFAIAMTGGSTGAGVLVLAPTGACTFEAKGTILLDIDGGAIQVNSTDPCAACGNGTPLLDTPALNVGGVPGTCFTPGVQVTGGINPGSPPIPDPLAYLPDPTWDPGSDLGTFLQTSDAVTTVQPGYYSGGIKVLGGEVTLAPGIYILDGAGFQIGGNATLIADGVMLYIIGTGYVDIDGTGIIRITPPDPELYSYPGVGTYEGVSIFQARDNTNPSRIIGTAVLDLKGSLYFPVAPLEIGGAGGDFGNQLIAWHLEMHGTGEIRVGYNGNKNAPGNSLFLVE